MIDMRPDLPTIIQRVALLHAHACRPAPDETLLTQIEDMLSEGYAQALTADAWSIRTEQRLHELLNNPKVRGRELRSLTKEHASVQRDVVVLRRALAELRHDRDRLHAASHTTWA